MHAVIADEGDEGGVEPSELHALVDRVPTGWTPAGPPDRAAQPDAG